MSAAQAKEIISGLLLLPGLHVLLAPTEVVAGWVQPLARHPVTGGDVFDLQIVETMLANGIRRIYTFNVDDFEVFSELVVVEP